jgi:hypothetical protein
MDKLILDPKLAWLLITDTMNKQRLNKILLMLKELSSRDKEACNPKHPDR